MTDPARLASARAVLERAGKDWTTMRAAVFAALSESDVPLSAYDVMDRVALRLRRRVNGMSVYRALDLFVSMHVAHRIATLRAYVAAATPGEDRDGLILLCRQCGTATMMTDGALAFSVSAMLHRSGFRAERAFFEVQGECGACEARRDDA